MLVQAALLLVPGLATGLVAGLLVTSWADLDTWARVAIGCSVSVLTVVVLVLAKHRHHRRGAQVSVATGLAADGAARIDGADVTTPGGNVEVASRIKTKKGDIVISNVKVKGRSESDENTES